MMGGMVAGASAAENWRPVSLEAIQHALSILHALADPKKTEGLLKKIAEAQGGFDEKAKLLDVREIEATRKTAELSKRERLVVAKEAELKKGDADLKAALKRLDDEWDRHGRVHDVRLAEMDKRESALAVLSSDLGRAKADHERRVVSVAGREAEADQRHKTLDAREKAVAAHEATIKDRQARLAELMSA